MKAHEMRLWVFTAKKSKDLVEGVCVHPTSRPPPDLFQAPEHRGKGAALLAMLMRV